MYKFTRSLIALTGLLALVGIATLGTPHHGRSASGTSSSAPTSQTQNVNVVNAPTVNAQQSGLWNVGINGTPTVEVANFPATTNVGIDPLSNTVKVDTTNPLPVRDVDNAVRQPFAAACTIQNNNGFPCTVTVVPPGKRLVIEMFQVNQQNVAPELVVVTNNTPITYRFFAPNQLVRIYADPGIIQVQSVPMGTVAVISGYLVDLP